MFIKDYSYGVVPFRCKNRSRQFLLVKHRDDDHWSFPKGHPFDAEAPTETALRELREETGIKEAKIICPDKFEEKYTYYKNGQAVKKKVTFFLAEVVGRQKKSQYNPEIADLCWLSEDEVISKMTYGNTKRLFRQVLKKLQKY